MTTRVDLRGVKECLATHVLALATLLRPEVAVNIASQRIWAPLCSCPGHPLAVLISKVYISPRLEAIITDMYQ